MIICLFFQICINVFSGIVIVISNINEDNVFLKDENPNFIQKNLWFSFGIVSLLKLC